MLTSLLYRFYTGVACWDVRMACMVPYRLHTRDRVIIAVSCVIVLLYSQFICLSRLLKGSYHCTRLISGLGRVENSFGYSS